MTLPAGITTFALNYGRPFNFKGDSFGKRLEITPSHDIVWAATGDPLKAILIADAVSVGELGTVALPHTDQAGFVDLNGDAITDWWYTVKAYTLDAAGRTVGAVVTRRIQVTSDVDDVDLELLPADATVGPVGSVPLPAILSVNGATGVVVITAAGIGAYELPETGVPASDLASAVQTSLGLADTALQPADVGTMAAQDAADYLTADQTNAAIVQMAVVRAEAPRTPQEYGARGNGVDDDTEALAAWAASSGGAGYVPPGVYLTSEKVVQPAWMNVEMSDGAEVKATATMDALWQVATVSTKAEGKYLKGGKLNSNGLADRGLFLMAFENFTVENMEVWSSAEDQIVVGDPSTPQAPYEARFNNVRTRRGYAEVPPGGGRSLWVRTATDGEYGVMQHVGSDIGVQVDTDSNRFIQQHAWGFEGKLPTTCFLDNADRNLWLGCEADSPSAYGWYLAGQYTNILGGRVFANTFVAQNTITGLYLAASSPNPVIHGLNFEGLSGHEILKDIDGAAGWQATSTVLGGSSIGVTSAAQRQTVPFLRVRGPLILGTDTGYGARLYSGSGAPSNSYGADGDFYFRTGSPSTANQRLYTKISNVWTGIL